MSIRPTKNSPYYGLLYKEVRLGIETLLSHLERERIWFEMDFNLYHTVAAGRMWKMAGRLETDGEREEDIS